MTFQAKRVRDIAKNHSGGGGGGTVNTLTFGTRVLMYLFGVCTLGLAKVFNPIRPGLFSRSPGPGGAQRPRCQKSRLTSTN